MNIYETLKQLKIEYEEVSHDPVFTAEQSQAIKNLITGVGAKNLFLTNKKDQYVLVLLEDSKRAKINDISKAVNLGHLTFASDEELEAVLKLKIGSVTPLGLINDTENKVTIVIDKDLENQVLLVHPCVNNKTISIKYNDLIKFIEYLNHKHILI